MQMNMIYSYMDRFSYENLDLRVEKHDFRVQNHDFRAYEASKNAGRAPSRVRATNGLIFVSLYES